MKMKNIPILPIELIKEILLRLPVRSVLRFKCVCKSWLSVIEEPQFGISHYDLAAAPSHRLLLRSNRFYIESIDIETSLQNYSGEVYLLLPPTLPPPPGACVGYSNYHDYPMILGSCRGLVVLYYKEDDDLILWNPSIGAHKPLPKFEYELTNDFLYGFGYDVSTDDYLMIIIALFDSLNDELLNDQCKGDIHILSFKTNWFPFMEIKVAYKSLGSRFRAGTLFHEAIHWLVFSDDKKLPVIIVFDLIQRSLAEIPLFDHFSMEKYQAYCLRVMGAYLSVCCWVRSCSTTEIWVMKDYKVRSSWTKFIVIPTYGRPRERFSPICITKDGQIFGSNICARLEKLNDEGEILDHLSYGGGEVNEANLQSAMYRESLLSLTNVIGGKK